ncbi:MAG: heat-inducible transcriptional repressor HrcA [Nitrospinales bacterium]
MANIQLDERSRNILLQTINAYISTAEPVSSRTLSKNLNEKLSPATIRNVMADLEEMGYLKQPHTSAGRIPTDGGYRVLVDQLLKLKSTVKNSRNPLQNRNYSSAGQNQTLEDVLGKTCNILSESSHQTGLIMLPNFSHMLLKQANFIKVGEKDVLAVFITEMGVLENKVIHLDSSCTQDDLTIVSNYLNQEFSGKSLKIIREELSHRIRNEKKKYNQLRKSASELWTKAFPDEDNICDLYVNGLINFLDHPEFTGDLDIMKSLLKTVEEKSKLVKLLDLCMRHDEMTIMIGEEHFADEMQGCSLIAQNYMLDNEKIGTVAIFGPKRMDYRRMISIVNNTANTVSDLLSERKIIGALQSS